MDKTSRQPLAMHSEPPSLQEPSGLCLLEAQRRVEELDNGTVRAVPSEDVMRKARKLLRAVTND